MKVSVFFAGCFEIRFSQFIRKRGRERERERERKHICACVCVLQQQEEEQQQNTALWLIDISGSRHNALK